MGCEASGVRALGICEESIPMNDNERTSCGLTKDQWRTLYRYCHPYSKDDEFERVWAELEAEQRRRTRH